MNKKYKYIFPCLFAIIVFINNGCDILSNFSANLPLKQGITVIGSNTTISSSETVYLSDYDAYADNIDKIQSITYLAAIYRTLPRGENPFPPPDSVDLTPGLVADNIIITVQDIDNNLIFTRFIPNAAADDYISEPDTISLTDDEIILMNEYLKKYKDPNYSEMLGFKGTITMENITAGSGPPYTLTAQIEILLDLVMEP